MVITIKEPKAIKDILYLIHDEWFDKNDIRFNQQTSLLQIKFRRINKSDKKIEKSLFVIKKITCPIIESFLIIEDVLNYVIDDKADIGLYDFDTIEYDEKKKKITINSNFPMKIIIKVKQFSVTIKDTNTVVDFKSFWSVFV